MRICIHLEALFLRRTFAVARAGKKVKPGSWLELEIEYLLKHGYEWSADGTKLVLKRLAH
jgi:hypothetical protein